MKNELRKKIISKQNLKRESDEVKKAHVQETGKVPVRIDARTIIFVLPSEVEGAKEQYLLSHQKQAGIKKTYARIPKDSR